MVSWAILPALAIMLISSCKEKPQVDERSLEQKEKDMSVQERDAKKEVIRFEETSCRGSAKYGGHQYAYSIKREVDKSAPIVLDDEGYRTADNAITLIVNCDGVQIHSKRYTKSAFKIGVNEEDFKQYVLMNIAFDQVTPNGLRFIACIGVGSSDDMFVQFALTVGNNGSTNIEQHEFFEENEIDRFKEGGPLPGKPQQ